MMAGRLLRGVIAALLLHGCLIPQDDPVLPDLPPQKNRPPRILVDKAEPGMVASVDLGDNCPRQVFSAQVDDPDFRDQLQHRWFPDPKPDFTTVYFDGLVIPALKANADGGSPSSTVRSVTQPFKLFSTGSVLFDAPGSHTLTLVVTDGVFVVGAPTGIEIGAKTSVLLEDGGPLDDPAYTAMYTWNVTTNRTPCP